MSHQDWISLFAPAVAAVVLALAGLIAALLTGLTGRVNAWLNANGQAQVATAISAANAVIQSALTTSASTIAGKVARGELDYTDRTALAAEAAREVGLVQQRIPQMLAVAGPAAATLVASMMAKVDAQLVASPTPLAGQTAATPAPLSPVAAILEAANTLQSVRAALDAPTPPVPAASPQTPAQALASALAPALVP